MAFETALNTLYRDLLLREPDAPGLGFWRNELESGRETLADVAEALLNSTEFRTEIRPILAIYEETLLRPADVDGLRYWVDEMREGRPLDAIRSAMENSAEATSQVTNLSDNAWLERAYATLLDRRPDEEGEAYWLTRLAEGDGRSEVMAAMRDSVESQTLQTGRNLTALLESEEAADRILETYREMLESLSEPPVQEDENDEDAPTEDPEPPVDEDENDEDAPTEDLERPADENNEDGDETDESPELPDDNDNDNDNDNDDSFDPAAALAITEVWPGQSGPDMTEDWFEITNLSDNALDLSSAPLYYDDDSADPEDAVAIRGLTELAPGESAIVIVDGGPEAVARFRAAWNNLEGIEGLSIGYAENASGLGGSGDAVTLWLGDPLADGVQVAFESYPDTEGFDAAAWDTGAERFVTVDDDGIASSSGQGGDRGDIAALASPGNTPELAPLDDGDGEELQHPDLGLGERYHVGASDASAAIPVSGRLMLVGDDEDQVLRLYDRDSDGEPLAEINLNTALGLNDTQEVDIEAVASLGDTQYWLGSHESGQRSLLFTTRTEGDDATSLDVNVGGQFAELATQLQAWDADNGHGQGTDALGLGSRINVEGAAFDGDTLLLGLRTPLNDGMAQVIPVTNAPSLVAGEADEAEFDAPLRLDMAGRVIRSIEPTGDDGFVVLAGPEQDGGEAGFALFHWDGAHAVREVEGVDLNSIPDTLGAKPEALFDIQAAGDGYTAGVLYDSGTVDWLDDGRESKDLPAELQRFIGVDIDIAELPAFSPQPGDIAITAVKADNPDDFQFVALKGIAAGTEITFTDSGWSGDSFRANEGAVTWTAPDDGVAPGTRISYVEQADQFRDANGDAVGNNGFNLSASGDQVIAFTGEASDPTFLFAVQTNSSEWQESATSASDSALPPGLEAGLTAVAAGQGPGSGDEWDNVAYGGPGTGTAAELLASIGNAANWAGDNSALPAEATVDFQVGTMETVHVPGERDIGLAITEIWSGQSGPDVTEDWFEITNRTSETLDVASAPLYYDDDSADPEDAVAIQGLTELAPGESAVVMVDGGAEAVSEFRAAWSNLQGIDSLPVGYAPDASGLSGGGDAVTLWQGNPRIDGDQIAFEAYPDTDGFDAAAWDVDAQRFVAQDDEGVLSSAAQGGDSGDVAALASPGTATAPETDITLISTIQGTTDASPLEGDDVTVEAIVTMVTPGLDGFFLQEEDSDNDDDPDSSEGLFVYTGSGSADWLEANLSAGDQIRIEGNVSEYHDKTQLSADRDSLQVLESGLALPESQRIDMPFTDKAGLEAFEGMRVAIEALDSEPLVVTELYQLGRYGEVMLSSGGRLEQFTEVNAPDPEGYASWQAEAEARTIKIDDANSAQNPDPVIYGRNGEELSAENPLRGGDALDELEGVLDFSFGEWKVQNVEGLDFSGPERPATPDTEALGNPGLTVASFNVLNYFTTLDESDNQTVTLDGTPHGPRGADNAEELARQETKLVEAINASGADVAGLMEIENNGYGADSAIATLVDALNAEAPEGVTWAYSVPEDADGNMTSPGDDAIAVGMLYNSEAVTPLGAAATKTDGAFATANRAPLLQTFEEVGTGEVFSAVVNHFKSKGSVVNGEEAVGDGQGNNTPTRVEAAEELRAWLASDPTGSGDSDMLIIGDLNSYAMEDPITTLMDGGYTRLNDDYSYVFDGAWGSLDHALASDSLLGQVSGATTWHINADEAAALDYNTDYTSDRQDENLYAPDAFRSSDHDPILVGLNLGEEVSMA